MIRSLSSTDTYINNPIQTFLASFIRPSTRLVKSYRSSNSLKLPDHVPWSLQPAYCAAGHSRLRPYDPTPCAHDITATFASCNWSICQRC